MVELNIEQQSLLLNYKILQLILYYLNIHRYENIKLQNTFKKRT